jgi:hypothetical protein
VASYGRYKERKEGSNGKEGKEEAERQATPWSWSPYAAAEAFLLIAKFRRKAQINIKKSKMK